MELQAAFDLLLSSEKPLDEMDTVIWQSLTAGASGNQHPWTIGCLMTFQKTGEQVSYPSGRTVVLRRCDAASRTLDFHTDVRSAKVKEMEMNAGAVCWLFYEPSTKIQLRAQGFATVVNDKRADAAWEAVSLQGRSGYLSMDPPGQRSLSQQPPSTADRFVKQLESERGRENFRLVRTEVQSLDWLYLRRGGHVRASITYDQKGSSEVSWLVP
ncbi:MAG: hypothetical protein CL917_04100 [Deltaproteobacteria bacterium]|nr:hypothetical protein [Deltaproteobacteria bacterium]